MRQLSLLVAFSQRRAGAESPDTAFRWLVEALPGVSPRPEIACARLDFDGRGLATVNYRPTPWRHEAPVVVAGIGRGALALGYLEPPSGENGGGCLPSGEPELIDALARECAFLVAYLEAIRSLAIARRIVENSPTMLFRVDAGPGWPLTFVSDNVARLGYTAADLTAGKTKLVDLIHPDDFPALERRVTGAFAAGESDLRLAYRTRTASGGYRHMDSKIAVLRDAAGHVAAIEGISLDVTEAREAQQRLVDLAERDTLTGLPNREAFLRRLSTTLAGTPAGDAPLAVLYLDIDRFKDVNDALGHAIGDRLLQRIGERLTRGIGAKDMIARVGDDEFAVLVDGVEGADRLVGMARSLGRLVAEPFPVEGNQVSLTASTGIAVAGPGSDAATLLQQADLALWQAKEEGRNTFCFHTARLDEAVQRRVATTNDLRQALIKGELFLVYQPEIRLETGRIIGLEALVRWRHPQRGVLSPGAFIPVAETAGLILPLGKWVLREALRQAAAWIAAGFPPVVIAVNFSSIEVKFNEFASIIAAALAESRFPAHLLEVELTETAFFEATQNHRRLLQRLRGLGVSVAIDDFGTGYSSLEYLISFGIDRLKVAQNFVRQVPADAKASSVVKATVGLGRDLGVRVIAEGVETADQVAFLRQLGCDEFQGYYFGRPAPPDETAARLRRWASAERGTGGLPAPADGGC